MGAPGSGYAPATAPALAFSGAAVPANLPTSSAGGERLVAAMEHVDRVVSIFLEDIGRAVAARARRGGGRARGVPARGGRRARGRARGGAPARRGRAGLREHRVSTEADLERRWAELRAEQESDKRERARVEREIRDMSQRATAETQAAALVQMQAAQAAQAASLRAALGGDQGRNGVRNESLSAGAYGGFRPAGLGAAGRPGGPRGVDGVDAPAATAPLAGWWSSRTWTGATAPPGGLAAHPNLPPPGHGACDSACRRLRAGAGVRDRRPRQSQRAAVDGGGVRGGARRLARASRDVRASRVPGRRARGPGRAPGPRSRAASAGRARVGRASPRTVLAIGGSDGARPLRSAEAFDFARGCVANAGAHERARASGWARRPSGSRTFAVGGCGGSPYLDLVEAFVPG